METYGSGAVIGMEKIIIPAALSETRKVHRVEVIACCAAAPGTTITYDLRVAYRDLNDPYVPPTTTLSVFVVPELLTLSTLSLLPFFFDTERSEVAIFSKNYFTKWNIIMANQENVLTLTYDLLLYLVPILEKFPRSQKFLASRL